MRRAQRWKYWRKVCRHPRARLWATEIWWSSKPPDPRGIKAAKQARYIEQALYLLWRQGAKVVINLQVRDPAQGASQVYAGVYFHDGKPKPALQAFRFPFVADRASRDKVHVWGKSPAAGRLAIERKAGGNWRAVKKVKVGRGKVFQAKLKLHGKQRLRATVGDEHSLPWRSH